MRYDRNQQDKQLQEALDKIQVEHYLDREGVDYQISYGTNGVQLNLFECPACKEGGRKTYINAETGLGNCFHGSCGFKFNKFKLIRSVSGLNGTELFGHIAAVAEEAGWIPKKVYTEIKSKEGLVLPSNLMNLPVTDPVSGRQATLQYLADRGVSIESCAKYHMSYCDKGWWSYQVEEGGVEVPKWVSYDCRVILPILDLDGNMVSFQGRDITDTKSPKYLFPHGFAVAGSHLYNGHNFTAGIHKHLVIGEGVFDEIAIDQALATDPTLFHILPVATFGMHLSGGDHGQIGKLMRLKAQGVTHVTFMWDGEGKAIEHAITQAETLSKLGFIARVAMLPPGYDPAQGPDKRPTPPSIVLNAFFKAEKYTKTMAIKMLLKAKRMT